VACFPRLRSRAAFYSALYGEKGFICWDPGDLKYSHQGDCPQRYSHPGPLLHRVGELIATIVGGEKNARGCPHKKLAPPPAHTQGGMGVGRAKIEGRSVCGGAGQKYQGSAPPKNNNLAPLGHTHKGGGGMGGDIFLSVSTGFQRFSDPHKAQSRDPPRRCALHREKDIPMPPR